MKPSWTATKATVMRRMFSLAIRPLRQHQYDQRIHRQIGHHKAEDGRAGDSVCVGQRHQEVVHLAQEDGKVGRSEVDIYFLLLMLLLLL